MILTPSTHLDHIISSSLSLTKNFGVCPGAWLWISISDSISLVIKFLNCYHIDFVIMALWDFFFDNSKTILNHALNQIQSSRQRARHRSDFQFLLNLSSGFFHKFPNAYWAQFLNHWTVFILFNISTSPVPRMYVILLHQLRMKHFTLFLLYIVPFIPETQWGSTSL